MTSISANSPTRLELPFMNVTEAVRARKSTRSFLPIPVADETIAELLTLAARAPSGGNVQPWIIYVLNGETTDRFRDYVVDRPGDPPEYDVYPPKLWDPYRTSRFELGEEMYALLGIGRDDKTGRLSRFAANYRFFDAPAAIFCFIDRRMGAPQWSDLGMFLQTLMLLCEEAGLQTCPQESWSAYGPSVAEFVGAPEELMLFCGMAIGHADPDQPVNQLESKRRPLDTWANWVD